MIVFETLLLLFLFICALTSILTKHLVTAIITFMSYSSIMAVLWLLLESPDLAITEAAVGAGVTTLLFFLALRRINAMKGVEEDDQ